MALQDSAAIQPALFRERRFFLQDGDNGVIDGFAR